MALGFFGIELVVDGCGGGSPSSSSTPVDPGTASTPNAPAAPDDMGAMAGTPQGGPWVPPGADDNVVAHAPPGSLAGATNMLGGVNVLDVSTDQGGGIWAVSASTVYYFPPGATTPVTYDQKSGLARGWYTWQDPYYSGTPDHPATKPVTFASVGGATPGQAVVGNMGAIADRLVVDPQTGAVRSIENLAITPKSTPDSFLDDHRQRVVGTVKVLANVDGVLNGSAYLGGYHGISALHGLKGDCGCRSDFDEHAHYVGCDSSGDQYGCWDGEVYGLAMSPDGNVWAGDRHFLQLLDQQNTPPDNNIMGQHFLQAIDVFPNLRDEIHGLAVDAQGGVYVASDGCGLAYVLPGILPQPIYWSSATTLPQNHVHGAALDQEGDLWVGTRDGGVARFDIHDNKWSYYTSASGLPADGINTVYVDQFEKSKRKVLIATTSGITLYQGQ